MDDKFNMTALAAMLEEQLSALLAEVFPMDNAGMESVTQWVDPEKKDVRGMAEEFLLGNGVVQSIPDRASVNLISPSGRAAGLSPKEMAITQNIYLRENDPSPYKTARAIRRESEAMLRI